jgi:hypothetical protein
MHTLMDPSPPPHTLQVHTFFNMKRGAGVADTAIFSSS